MGKATLDDLLKEQKKTNELLKKIARRPIQVSVKTEGTDAKEVLNSTEKMLAEQLGVHL